MTIRTSLFCILLICLGTATACEAGNTPYQFCENEDELALPASCDISESACQQAVFETAKCVNGSTMPMPPVRMITRSEYLAELGMLDTDTDSQIEPVDTETDSVSDSESDTDTVSHWDESMRLLGLIKPETSVATAMNEDFLSTSLAYYSSEYQDVTIIIDDNNSRGDTPPMYVLAHEFTHAIQDYEVGILEQREMYSYDDDILIAQDNSCEGDAVVRADFAFALLNGIDFADLNPGRYYLQYLEQLKHTIAEAESPYALAKKALVYGTGALYVYETYEEEGLDGINRLRENFPTSSVYWMAGYDSSHQLSEDSRPTQFNKPLTCAAAAAPEHYDLKHQDTMGAAMLFAVLSSQQVNNPLTMESSWNFSLNWRADTLRIFRQTDGDHIAVAWHLRMATEKHAQRLMNLLHIRHPNAHAIQHGTEVIEFLANDTTVISEWAQTYTCEKSRE